MMLETIREYVLQKLREGNEEEQARRRHLEYYTALAEEAEPELAGADQTAWLTSLESEHDNFRAALSWARAHAGACGLQLGGALWRFWHLHGHLSEGRMWLEGMLDCSSDSEPDASEVRAYRARALNGAGNLAMYQGDFARAMNFDQPRL